MDVAPRSRRVGSTEPCSDARPRGMAATARASQENAPHRIRPIGLLHTFIRTARAMERRAPLAWLARLADHVDQRGTPGLATLGWLLLTAPRNPLGRTMAIGLALAAGAGGGSAPKGKPCLTVVGAALTVRCACAVASQERHRGRAVFRPAIFCSELLQRQAPWQRNRPTSPAKRGTSSRR